MLDCEARHVDVRPGEALRRISEELTREASHRLGPLRGKTAIGRALVVEIFVAEVDAGVRTGQFADVRARAQDFISGMIDLAAPFGASVIVGSMQGRADGEVSHSQALNYLGEALAKLSEVGEDNFVGAAGVVYALAGRNDDAIRIIEKLERRSRQAYISPTTFAFIYAALGDKDNAIAYLEKGYEERAFQMQFLKIDPRWDKLRDDPRFADLMRRVSLPE